MHTLAPCTCIKIHFKDKFSTEINTLFDKSLPEGARFKLPKIIKKNYVLFGPINANELIQIAVKTEIRTNTENPYIQKSAHTRPA